MKLKFFTIIIALVGVVSASAQTRIGTLLVETEPEAIVWIDGVKRGVTDETGKLEIKPVRKGSTRIKIRAYGFKQVVKSLLPTQGRTLKVALVKTTSPSEKAFQEAEKILSEDKEKAIELYKKAVRLRPSYAEAYVALARALTGRDNDAAHKAIATARRLKRFYAEASTVEGRIYRAEGEIDKAIDSFDRAVKEGKGFQPEAHTGLGLIFKEEAEGANAAGDYDDEKFYGDEAAKSFEKAIDQLSATEPIVYILLGSVYEKINEKQKAIAVYERFLRDFPVNNERSAVESFIVQIKREMNDGQ